MRKKFYFTLLRAKIPKNDREKSNEKEKYC